MIPVRVTHLFTQKPPTPQVGAQRRDGRNLRAIVMTMQFIGAGLFPGAVVLPEAGGTTDDVLAYYYALAVIRRVSRESIGA